MVAKALDLFVRELNLAVWNEDQADVQYLGEGSSHELAALLLTEAVQHSLYTAKNPLFALYLDAQSAFDTVLRKTLVTNLFHCGTTDGSLLYIDNWLASRTTFVEWNKQIMGPIQDELGLEQGGANSGDLYKVHGKEQLIAAQSSGLGVKIGAKTISAIGQADDTVIISNSLDNIHNLLQLTLDFCRRYHVKLCFEKTKLQVIYTPTMANFVEYSKLISPVNIEGKYIPFVDSAEHVGILRNSFGNLPNILNRIKAHRSAMGAVLHSGIARNHRGNPAASIKIEKLHGTPVLLSGLGALVLLKPEIQSIDHHHKVILENLMRLHPRTPQCVVSFLAGSLPGTALVHQRMLGIFGMICRLKDDILNHLATQMLIAAKPST